MSELLREVRALRSAVSEALDRMAPVEPRLSGPGSARMTRAFSGPSGLRMLLGLPGFVGLWFEDGELRRVPESHLDLEGGVAVRVRCTCGVTGPVEDQAVVPCEGECGRWFLVLGGVVAVKRFEAPAETAA